MMVKHAGCIMAIVSSLAFPLLGVGAESDPPHGTAENTVSKAGRVAVGQYGQNVDPSWTYLELDTKLAAEDISKDVGLTWSAVFTRSTDTRWELNADKSEHPTGKDGKPLPYYTRKVYGGVLPDNAAGRRVFVDVRGGFHIPAQGNGGPGNGKPAGPLVPYTRMVLAGVRC